MRTHFFRWFLGIISSLLIAGAGVVAWALWVPTPEQLLAPLHISKTDLNLRTPSSAASQPILIIIDTADSNVFARYICEILKTEGISTFETVDLSSFIPDNSILNSRSLVISATNSKKLVSLQSVLTTYVQCGGSLLMIDPPKEFDPLLGIKDLGATLADGSIQIDSTTKLLQGLCTIPLQYFGPARLCEPTSSTPLAYLSESNSEKHRYPAVGVNKSRNGKTGYVTFDLGRSIVFARQGKPLPPDKHIQLDKDGDHVYRTADLFYDTFDYSKHLIPQADELQKLFVRLIYTLLDESSIIPRVWYFPNGSSAVALLTGDAHYTPAPTVRRIVEYVESKGGKFTLFEYPIALDTNLVDYMVTHGHTVAPHLYYQRHDNIPMRLRLWIANWFSASYFFRPRFSDLRDEVVYGTTAFRNKVGFDSPFSRTHFLIWWGWDETARLLSSRNFRMDFSVTGVDPHNQYSVPSGGNLKSPTGFGYINGSGLPMRFVDREGNLGGLYLQSTLVEDDVMGAAFITTPLSDSITTGTLIQMNRKLIDDAVDKYHTAIVYNFHPQHAVERFPTQVPLTWKWITATIDHLAERKVPMLSSDSWLRFVEARRCLRIQDIFYDRSTLRGSLTIVSPSAVEGLSLLLPLPKNITKVKSLSVVAAGLPEHQLQPAIAYKDIGQSRFLQLILNVKAEAPLRVKFAF